MSAENISYDLKRFAGIKRDYTEDDVERLRGSIKIEYSMCKMQSQKLWKLLNTESYVGNKVISILPGTHISFRLNDEVKKKGCCACIMCFFRKEPELPDIVDASFVGPSRASGTDL